MRRPRDQDGFVTLWVLGVCAMVLFVGGITLDLWRAVATQRAVSAAVDGAAVAGSSGLDEAAFRGSGGDVVQLDPGLARQLAADSLGAQPGSDKLVDVAIEATPARITVRAGRRMDFALLKVFLPREDPLVLHASSSVDPRRLP
ncbi:MAG: pilus assembly protein TadG-related protein [Actinomycetota bacterium]|nr:pilus assembly protein TadG-related protein [Actinomycetota bacterium]